MCQCVRVQFVPHTHILVPNWENKYIHPQNTPNNCVMDVIHSNNMLLEQDVME